MLKIKQDVIAVLNNISDFERIAEGRFYNATTSTIINVHKPENPFDNYGDIICQVTIVTNKNHIPVHKFLMRAGTPVDTFKNYINNLIGGDTECPITN